MRQIIMGISAVLIAAFLDLTDNTSVSVAFPSIAESLGMSNTALQWVSIGNTLALGAGLALGGQLGDNYGRRKMFLIGAAGYIVTSLLCAVAPTGAFLVTARIVQGLVGSLMIPQIFGIIKSSVPREKQAAVFGAYGSVLSIAAIAGPLLGGILVTWNAFDLSWRLVFLFNVPFAVLAFVLGYVFLPESRASGRRGIDVMGAIIIAGATTLVLLPLSLMSTSGWPSWGAVSIIGAVALYLCSYFFGQWLGARGKNPLVNPALLGNKQFSLGVIISLLFFSVIGAVFIILALYLTHSSGRSAFGIGLVMLPYALGSVVTSGVSTPLAARYGQTLCISGAFLSALSMALFAWLLRVQPQPAYWQYAIVLTVGGLGMGLCAPILIDTVLSAVPQDDVASASGLLNTVSQVAAAAGIAVFVTWYFESADAKSFARVLAVMAVVYGASGLLTVLLPRQSVTYPTTKG
jgi:hypothetical protein